MQEVIACKDFFQPSGVVIGSLVKSEDNVLQPDLKFVG